MLEEESRPVHVNYDCTEGTVEENPVTDEEWDGIKMSVTAAAEEEKKTLEKEEYLRNQVLQRNDSVLTELAKRAGIL